MSAGDAIFWGLVVLICLGMLLGFLLMGRGPKKRTTFKAPPPGADVRTPRGRYRAADKVDLRETDSRL